MSTDDHPAVKALHKTLQKLPAACDGTGAAAARTKKKLRQKRRELRREVNEMQAEDGFGIEDPESVDLLEDEFDAQFAPETPELA